MSETKSVVTKPILVDGKAVPETVQILSVVVTRAMNKIPTAVLQIRDGDAAKQDFEHSSSDLFVPGAELEVQVGYESDEASIYKGLITHHGIRLREGGDSILKVTCKDAAFRMTVGLHNQYYFESKDSDALEEIIGEYDGLSADVEATKTEHPALVQYQATDWDFTLTRAEANGLAVFVRDGEVKIAAPDVKQGALPDAYVFGDTLKGADLELDGRYQYPKATGATWAAADQAVVETEGTAPGMNKQGNLDSDTLGGDLKVPEVHQVHAGQALEAEMTSLNDAQLLKGRLGRIRGYAKVQGLADLDQDTVVTFEGIGDRMNGDAYVTGVRHEINEGEWITLLDIGADPEWFANQHGGTLRTASTLIPAIGGLHIGVVTTLEGDPDGEDRIQVQLPMIDPAEDGLWCRIAKLDAGDSRGSIFLPEVGDEVIVGFLHEDPRNPIVLGQLHSSAKPSPIPGADDNHEKGFITRDQLQLLFNDDLLQLDLETPAGNKVSLSEDQGGIFLEDENGNKATLNSDGITLESAKDIILKAGSGDVKIEGVNVEIAAQANFKADGGAGAEVTTSAVAVLKGSLVQIN